jgi:hypothetical protein
MRKNLIACFLIFSILIPLAGYSGDFFGLGPRAGYYKAKDAEEGQWFGGAGLRIKMGSIGFEGSIDYRAEKYVNGNLTIRSWPVMASVLFYPLPILYGVAGAGWYNTTFDYDQDKLIFKYVKDKTDQEVGWHFGGGLELPLGRKSALAVDIRYVFLDYDFSEVPGSDELDSDFYAVTITLFLGL